MSLLLRVRRATLVVVGLCTVKEHCTRERPLSFGSQPRCDVPAVGTQNQPALAWRATAPVIYLDKAQQLSLLLRARRATLFLVGLRTVNEQCTDESHLSFGARTWCAGPAAASQNQLAFAWHLQAHHCAG